jgi:hypothetical protein
MLLYWSILKSSAERGCDTVDFGRSTRNSGTHAFKQLWNTTDVPLHWATWSTADRPNHEPNQESPLFKFASTTWMKLPLFVCNAIGPRISRNLP